jgi:hypothetical protein
LTTNLEDELTGTTVAYDSHIKAFTVNSPTTGVNSTIDYASGTIAVLLNLTESGGAVVSPGYDAMSAYDNLDLIKGETENWVSFTTTWEVSNEEGIMLATWANDNYGYLYVAWTSDDSVKSKDDTTDLASLIKDGGYDHTTVVFGYLRHAAFVQGSIASIPWQRLNGVITLAFKSLTGLESTVSKEVDAAVLDSKNCNYYGNFATRNAEFRFFYNGVLSSSIYRFIDSYINSVWLNALIQRTLVDCITSDPKTSYTQRGYNLIRAWFNDPIEKAINNGAIEKGLTLSSVQKEELLAESGKEEAAAEVVNYGYYLQVLDPGAEARTNRSSPIINLWYAYAGAVQRLEVASTVIL